MTDAETVTTTVTMSPPKYQTTIPKEVRKGLDIEGKKALLELEIRVVKVLEENGGDS